MVCVMEGTLVGFFSRCFGTFEGELREESKDGVEAELALKKYKNVKKTLKTFVVFFDKGRSGKEIKEQFLTRPHWN